MPGQFVQGPEPLLQIQPPDNVPGKLADDVSSTWLSPTDTGDQSGVLISAATWFIPGYSGHQGGVSQQMEISPLPFPLSFPSSLPFPRE